MGPGNMDGEQPEFSEEELMAIIAEYKIIKARIEAIDNLLKLEAINLPYTGYLFGKED